VRSDIAPHVRLNKWQELVYRDGSDGYRQMMRDCAAGKKDWWKPVATLHQILRSLMSHSVERASAS
jgi:hypothetical protein